jgi:PAS domain S-box-containing protein
MESFNNRWLNILDKNGLVWASDAITILVIIVFFYKYFLIPVLKAARKINKYIPVLISISEEFHSDNGLTLRDVIDKIDKTQHKLENQIHDISYHMNIGFYETDHNGDCINVNNQWCVLTGLLPSEAYGSGWIISIHEDDRDRIWREWRDAVNQERDFVGEYFINRKNGGKIKVRGACHVIKNNKGNVVSFVGSIMQLGQAHE